MSSSFTETMSDVRCTSNAVSRADSMYVKEWCSGLAHCTFKLEGLLGARTCVCNCERYINTCWEAFIFGEISRLDYLFSGECETACIVGVYHISGHYSTLYTSSTNINAQYGILIQYLQMNLL